MRLFLEVAFKNFYYFISNVHYRTFYILLMRFGNKQRYQALNTKVYKYYLYIPDALSFIWQYKEIFVDESYRFNPKSSNGVIVDCGANIGLSGLFFKSNYPNHKLYCIEADPKIADVMRRNFMNNSVEAEIIAKAAWINNEGVSFDSEGSDSGSVNTEHSNNAAKIESMDFNEFLMGFEKIDFLKMDIEGAENIVIPRCLEGLKKVEHLFLEYHSSYNDSQELPNLLSILKESGFHFYIKNENKRKSPFVNLHKERAYDLQLNIYAYRKA